jgi:hypothetical protein
MPRSRKRDRYESHWGAGLTTYGANGMATGENALGALPERLIHGYLSPGRTSPAFLFRGSGSGRPGSVNMRLVPALGSCAGLAPPG